MARRFYTEQLISFVNIFIERVGRPKSIQEIVDFINNEVKGLEYVLKPHDFNNNKDVLSYIRSKKKEIDECFLNTEKLYSEYLCKRTIDVDELVNKCKSSGDVREVLVLLSNEMDIQNEQNEFLVTKLKQKNKELKDETIKIESLEAQLKICKNELARIKKELSISNSEIAELRSEKNYYVEFIRYHITEPVFIKHLMDEEIIVGCNIDSLSQKQNSIELGNKSIIDMIQQHILMKKKSDIRSMEIEDRKITGIELSCETDVDDKSDEVVDLLKYISNKLEDI